MPLVARYDLAALRVEWSRASLAGREPTMWRYREVMPLRATASGLEEPISLGEGWTPLLHARRLGAALGLDRLFTAISGEGWIQDGPDWERERLSLYLPFIVIATPIWWLHWRMAQRAAGMGKLSTTPRNASWKR